MKLTDYEYYREPAGVIYCGDCLEILPLLEPGSVDLVVTDPPYGMNWNTDSTRFTGGLNGHRSKHGQGKIYGSNIIGDEKQFDPSHLLGFDKVVIWGYNHFAHLLPKGSLLIWIKRLDDAFGSFLSDAELAWMSGGCGVYCRRDLSMAAITRERQHPTQKPKNIMKWCIDKANTPGVICDPYFGSGTTLVAAKQLGRKFIGIEIEEKYCEIAKKQLAQEELALAS